MDMENVTDINKKNWNILKYRESESNRERRGRRRERGRERGDGDINWEKDKSEIGWIDGQTDTGNKGIEKREWGEIVSEEGKEIEK